MLSEDTDNEYAMLDSAIARAHQLSAGATGNDKNRVPRVCRVEKLTPRFTKPTMRREMDQLQICTWTGIGIGRCRCASIKAFGRCAVGRSSLYRRGTCAQAIKRGQYQDRFSTKKSRFVKIDHARSSCKARHLIENFFAKIKQYRSIATRSD